MKDELIDDVVREMLPHLDNSQAKQLKKVLKHHLECYDVQKGRGDEERMAEDNRGVVRAFISAKRIEGCSEKTLDYYRRTIEVMLDGVGKGMLYFNQSNKASVVYESAGIGKCKEYLNARRP